MTQKPTAHHRASPLLIHEPPLQVLPSLAVAVGLNEAIVLQQIHYWLQRSQNEINGHLWVYNSVAEWKKQFPFWATNTHPVIHISPKNIGQKPNLPRVAHKTGRFARCERFSAVFGQLHGRAQYTQEWSRCENLSVSY